MFSLIAWVATDSIFVESVKSKLVPAFSFMAVANNFITSDPDPVADAIIFSVAEICIAFLATSLFSSRE